MGERLQVVEMPVRAPNADLVEYCEKLLEEARSGEVVSIVGIKFSETGAFGTFRQGLRTPQLHTIGALEFMKHDIIQANEG